MKLHWDDLRFLLEVHRGGSYLAASKRLNVSHTTVARHIARLREAMGRELFKKKDSQITLTETGQIVLELAQRMDNVACLIEEQSSHIDKSSVGGKIRIGAPDGIGNAFLSQQLPKLLSLYPSLEVELLPVPASVKVWRRDVDIAISLDRPDTGRLKMKKLTNYDLRLYGSADLITRTGVPESVADLTQYPFVGYIDDLLYTEELNFNHLIVEGLQIKYKSATVKGQLDAIASGIGIGVLPCFMADGKGLIPLLANEIQFQRTYWILIPEDIRAQQKVSVTVEFLTSLFADNPDYFRFAPDQTGMRPVASVP